jgi:hypothetical protein
MDNSENINIDKLDFIVILSDYILPKELPIKLNHWTIDKPNKDELNKFHKIVNSYTQTNVPIRPNQEMGKIEKAGHSTFPVLNDNEFRYLILKPQNNYINNRTLNQSLNYTELHQAGRLSDSDIWINITALQSGPTTYNGGVLSAFYNIISRPFGVSLDYTNFSNVIQLRHDLDEKRFPWIKRAISMFMEQDNIRHDSYLKHLGYFTIIESLLSHKPNPGDSIDSISRQLKRNLILIENRMEGNDKLWLNSFNGVNPDKVIAKLYEYRSEVAHGGTDFTKLFNWFSINKPVVLDEEIRNLTSGKNWIGWYLRNLTKRIIVHSMKEPQLINDLK